MRPLFLFAFTVAATWAATGFSNQYNITAVRGISAGAVKLASSNTVTPTSATIFWGDGTSSAGYIAQPCVYCDIWGTGHTYAAAGTYTITVTYYTGCCVSYSTKVRATVREIGANDFLVISVGDSVASGEGNPIIRGNPALWSDGIGSGSTCHLSTISGPAMAVSKLRAANPGVPITFLNMACTGATIQKILTAPSSSQIMEARRTIRYDRGIDALFVSAGANDVAGGFGSIVSTCADAINCSTNTTLAASIANDISQLPAKFAEATPNMDQTMETYLTEYYDPTKDQFGNYYGGCTLGVLSNEELQFLDLTMLIPMNSTLASVAAAQKWNLVNGIASDFRTHGLCSLSSWVTNLLASGVNQGNIDGTGHPNSTGHDAIAARLYTSVNRNTATTTTTYAAATYPDLKPIGTSYLANNWINSAVQLSFAATNKLPSAGARPYYRISSTTTCGPEDRYGVAYSQPVVFSDSGEQTICYFGSNAAGKFRETVKGVRVRIDRTAPVTTATQTLKALNFTATDTWSGVAFTDYRVDNGPWVRGSSVDFSSLKIGPHTVDFCSEDKAGNREAIKSITISVII